MEHLGARQCDNRIAGAYQIYTRCDARPLHRPYYYAQRVPPVVIIQITLLGLWFSGRGIRMGSNRLSES